jgi:hypothetical protein
MTRAPFTQDAERVALASIWSRFEAVKRSRPVRLVTYNNLSREIYISESTIARWGSAAGAFFDVVKVSNFRQRSHRPGNLDGDAAVYLSVAMGNAAKLAFSRAFGVLVNA